MSVLAPPPSPSPSSCFDAMLSDSDINIDRKMASNSLKRKASTGTNPHSSHGNASSSDAENRPILSSIADRSRTKVGVQDKQRNSATTSRSLSVSPSPASKKLKLSSTTPLVELKNGRLVLKQKAVNWAGMMPVMKAVIAFQEYLDGQESLDEIPVEHLHVIAKLAHESEKSLVELAKTIRSRLAPETELGSSDSEISSSASTAFKGKLSLSAIQSAIGTVAERRNYGIDMSDIPSHSSTSTSHDTPAVPAALQLWRWEVIDDSMLPEDFLTKLSQRRSDREAAHTQAQQLFANLKQEERQALLDKSSKSRISATVAIDKPCSSTSTPSKSKAKASITAARSTSTEPITIEDELDDGSVADNEHDRESLSTPIALHKRKSSSSASTPQPTAKRPAAGGEASTPSASSSPKEKRKAKESMELSPEKQKEKDEKEAAKAERLKAKEAKRLERETKELEKQKAKEAKEAELKKAEEQKKRQANFFTSFVKKVVPKSPTKSTVGAAIALGSVAAGHAAGGTVSDFERTFLPCQYKDLAPINRFARPAGTVKEPQMGQEALTREEMLSQLITRSSVLKGSAPRRRKGVHPPVSVRDIKRIVTESDVLGGNAQEQAEKALEALQDRNKVQLKLLQFESDRRPGWYGTWTKSTNLIGPRCPLGQDPVSLDYSYDSDADWEEMGQVEGEDVQDGEEKEDDSVVDEDEDSEMDDWLVDDLEVEEEEEQQRLAAMDVDDDDVIEIDAKGLPVPPVQLAATTNLLHPKKKKKVKLLGRRFDAKLVPFSAGPHWEGELGRCDYELFSSYRIEFLNDACFGLNPFTFTCAEPMGFSAEDAVPPAAMDTDSVRRAALPAGGVLAALWGEANPESTPALRAKDSSSFKHQLREDAIPALLKCIDGSTKTRAGLVDDIKERLDQLGKSASKNAIAERISAYAKKEKKPNSPWIVKGDWRSSMA